jgi:lysylphosphatidylglycerol synthetase-like protein (DUF2156 family)
MSEETTNSTETIVGNNSDRTNAGRGMGVAALVLGILAVICSFIPCFSFWAILFGALAIIFGAIGMSQAGKQNGKKELPKAGLILGIIGTLFALIWWFMFAGAIAASSVELIDAVKQLEQLK